jgi:glyceraldehyde 3-phosphate dehydrogenase
VAQVEKVPGNPEEINQKLRAAAQGPLKGILETTDEPLVSVDFNGCRASSTVDLENTMVCGNLVKILSWYDNEMGYSSRLLDLARLMSSKL